eukprot:6529266-Pyramimonas_sp.AAC.1
MSSTRFSVAPGATTPALQGRRPPTLLHILRMPYPPHIPPHPHPPPHPPLPVSYTHLTLPTILLV